MKIYVGNLSYDTTEEEIREEFAEYGVVESVALITDRYTGQPKGFGFIEMPTISEGQAAIAALNGKNIKDRAIVVNTARSHTDSRGGGSYGKRKGGGGGGFGRGKGRRY
jgi:RNA recognition motif-containing protein